MAATVTARLSHLPNVPGHHQVHGLKNIAQFIADKLETMILGGDLRPGSRLIQTDVAEHFGVSRLPVRDAFAVLLKKDLVVRLPRKGVMVREISQKEVNDLFELRFVLESFAVQKSMPLLTDDDIATANGLIKRQEKLGAPDFLELLDLDESFHRLLWSRCDNEEVTTALNSVWRRIRFIRAFARSMEGWRADSVKGHRKIIDALLRNDREQAAHFVVEGIDRSRLELIAEVAERQEHLRSKA